jgi:peptidoglycan/LPS O-acetylase OafA/YrhL
VTRLPHTPALDGVRGIAVAAVLLFHAGVGWAVGGHLGVTVFFALSGFLITSLLLSEHDRSGHVDLRAFWARRARRLVPALSVALVLVAAVAAWSANPADGVLQDAVATMTWSANWWFLHEGQSYADLFHDPSPLQHTWSLAVEEQYYLLFPLLLLVLVRRGRAVLGTGLVLLGVASVAISTWLSLHGAASSRLHFGTDVRVAEILAGAALAVVLHHDGRWRELPSRAVPLLGAVAAGFLLWSMATVEDDSRYLQRGGWALTAVATCVVLVAAVQPGSLIARGLGAWPLAWLGQVSYGAYLYHWPLYLLITKQTTGLDGPGLLLVRLSAVLLLADVSLRLLELPVRRTRFSLAGGAASWAFAGTAGLVAVGLATGAIVLPSLPPGPSPVAAGAQAAAPLRPAQQQLTGPQQGPQQRTATTPQTQALTVQRPSPVRAPSRHRELLPPAFTQNPDTRPVPPMPAAGPNQLRVAVIGDSLGDNLGGGLSRWAHTRSDVVVYDLAIPGCPLGIGGERRFSAGRPFPVAKACRWWTDSSSKWRHAFDAFAPQVVVMEDGVNELLDRRLASWSDWHFAGEPQFDQWLTEQYGKLIDTFGGAQVLMVNTPCADWQRYGAFADVPDIDGRIAAVNSDQSSVVGIRTADLRNRICPGGRYSDNVEGDPNGRPDGLHLSDRAATALARNWLGPLVLVTSKPTGIIGTTP